MTTPEQLHAWAIAGESETLEFKRSTGEQRAAMHALTAMLNHRGGRVLFGVEAGGRVLGQHVSDRTLEDLVQEIGHIEPPVFPGIERIPIARWPRGAGRFGIAGPEPAVQPPRRGLQAHGQRQCTSVARRVQPHAAGVPARRAQVENEPAEGWTAADLDGAEIVRTVEEAIRGGRVEDPATRDPAELLRGLGLIREGKLLRAAVALFGREEALELRMPQCLLRVARFRGTDRTEFADNRQFHGNVFGLLQRAERFLRESLPVAGRVPRPDIQDTGGCVSVRFAPARYIPPQRVAHDLTDRQRAVLALLDASGGGMALRDVRRRMEGQATEWEVRGDLQLLRQLGLAESLGRGRGAFWRLLQK